MQWYGYLFIKTPVSSLHAGHFLFSAFLLLKKKHQLCSPTSNLSPKMVFHH